MPPIISEGKLYIKKRYHTLTFHIRYEIMSTVEKHTKNVYLTQLLDYFYASTICIFYLSCKFLLRHAAALCASDILDKGTSRALPAAGAAVVSEICPEARRDRSRGTAGVQCIGYSMGNRAFAECPSAQACPVFIRGTAASIFTGI